MFRVSFDFDTLLAQSVPVAAFKPAISQRTVMPKAKGLSRKDMCNLFFPNTKSSGQCATYRTDGRE